MSINVSVIGNTISVRRGQMFMTDLDQIKKNERDRLRRLRLEQVNTTNVFKFTVSIRRFIKILN